MSKEDFRRYQQFIQDVIANRNKKDAQKALALFSACENYIDQYNDLPFRDGDGNPTHASNIYNALKELIEG